MVSCRKWQYSTTREAIDDNWNNSSVLFSGEGNILMLCPLHLLFWMFLSCCFATSEYFTDMVLTIMFILRNLVPQTGFYLKLICCCWLEWTPLMFTAPVLGGRYTIFIDEFFFSFLKNSRQLQKVPSFSLKLHQTVVYFTVLLKIRKSRKSCPWFLQAVFVSDRWLSLLFLILRHLQWNCERM